MVDGRGYKSIQRHVGGVPEPAATIHVRGPVWDCRQSPVLGHDATATEADYLVIDMSTVRQASTVAFAQLIKMKSLLLRENRDLRVRGLHGQPMALCRILKLTGMLLEPESPMCGPAPHRANDTTAAASPGHTATSQDKESQPCQY